MLRKLTSYSWVVAICLIFLFGCKDETDIFKGNEVQISFSSDTVVFDTVFTSDLPRIPLSVNKQFVVRNSEDQAVLSSFELAGGAESSYRINVDGYVGPKIEDVLIGAHDSVFVFVEISVDENDDINSLPLIVRDSIRITTNNQVDQVQLVAWGQDAHYFNRDTLCNATLDDQQKPYVVYGYLYVPENCTLTIKEGVRLHFAPRSWLYVEGTLKIEGDLGNEVVLQGDRLQPSFEESAGQWGGVWLNYLSQDNRIDYAIIKNGTVGIFCDSSSRNGQPNVRVTNTIIRNMTFDGLSAKESYVVAENSVFTNCGRYTFLGLWGGYYNLRHCNFTTYNFQFGRREPTFALNNAEIDEFFRIRRLFQIGYTIQNCIIDGALLEEYANGIIKRAPDNTNLVVIDSTFSNCLIRTQQKAEDIGNDNIVNVTPAFMDAASHDYRLKANSGALDIGTPIGVISDIAGKTRDSKPDAGAYEYVP